jgi:hypothetical protein
VAGEARASAGRAEEMPEAGGGGDDFGFHITERVRPGLP